MGASFLSSTLARAPISILLGLVGIRHKAILLKGCPNRGVGGKRKTPWRHRHGVWFSLAPFARRAYRLASG
jgi:hypothetical protein